MSRRALVTPGAGVTMRVTVISSSVLHLSSDAPATLIAARSMPCNAMAGPPFSARVMIAARLSARAVPQAVAAATSAAASDPGGVLALIGRIAGGEVALTGPVQNSL